MSKVLTRKGLLQYIQSSKALSASSRQIVLGNESGDLDSSISSIVYSYFLSVNGKDEILPVLNYPSSDFVLRPETKAMFDKSNIRSSDLVFKDQIDFQSSNLEYVYLVDHNRLSRSQSFLAPKVISVIDHHVDESDSLVNLKYKKIETVGSACTIVAEDILKEYSLDESIATLLLSAILSDTFNLDTNGDRTTDKDIHIAKQLASFINPNESEKNVYSSIFEYVETAKYDTSSISSFDLLRKDYKQWTIERDNNKNSIIMGISAVPLSFEEWDNRDSNLSLQFEKYSNENQLDILFVLTMFTEPEFNRQLGVYVKNDSELYEKVKSHLFSFDLNPKELVIPNQNQPNEPALQSFYSISTKYSRKKFSPIISSFLSKI